MSETGRDLILAGAILSILVSPLLFVVAERIRARTVPREETPAAVVDELPPTTLRDHTVLIGHGRVGGAVAAVLAERGEPFLVVEEDKAIVERLRAAGVEVISGTAARPELVGAAGLVTARRLVLAIPDPFESGNLVEMARAANPAIDIVARAHSEAQAEHLTRLGADRVVMGEREIALAITNHMGRDPRAHEGEQPGGRSAGSTDEAHDATSGAASPDHSLTG